MWMLVGGLALFFAHLIPTFPDVRTRLVGIIGRGPYAGLVRQKHTATPMKSSTIHITRWPAGATQGPNAATLLGG